MNQILSQNLSNKKFIITGYKKNSKPNFLDKYKQMYKNISINVYKAMFLISSIIIVVSVSYTIQDNLNRNKMSRLAENLSNSFTISRLYSNNNSSTATENAISNNIVLLDNEESNFSVIGLIKIDKIKISYSILSNISDDLLKISPCRFYGPMPNEIGNMCIAAHNYDDNRFFSRINKLKKGDNIEIYDINRKS